MGYPRIVQWRGGFTWRAAWSAQLGDCDSYQSRWHCRDVSLVAERRPNTLTSPRIYWYKRQEKCILFEYAQGRQFFTAMRDRAACVFPLFPVVAQGILCDSRERSKLSSMPTLGTRRSEERRV